MQIEKAKYIISAANSHNETLPHISVLCYPLDLTATFWDLRYFDVQISTPGSSGSAFPSATLRIPVDSVPGDCVCISFEKFGNRECSVVNYF